VDGERKKRNRRRSGLGKKGENIEYEDKRNGLQKGRIMKGESNGQREIFWQRE